MRLTPHFDAFYRSSFEWVFRATLAYCGDREVALDSTQEAFSRALARWRRVRNHEAPRGWVLVTAINVSKRHARREQREAFTAPQGDGEAVPSGDRVDITSALRSLSPRRRQAVVLHYLADYPINVVADLMGVSEGAVKAHLSQARTALKQHLSAFDDEPTR